MSKIPMSPLAGRILKEGGYDINDITPTGVDGNIRYIRSADVKRVKITPLAKKISDAEGIDPGKIISEKKIRKSDILKFSAELNKKNAAKLSHGRSIIYENLSKSVMETIPYTLFAKIDTGKAYEYYKSLKNTAPAITLTDIFTFAVAKALRENIILNVTRCDGYYINNEDINICLAVDTGGSIVTPVMKNADRLSVSGISSLRTEFLRKIDSSHLSADFLTGGTFTISNLGRGVVEYFTPVINYPQSGIIGIGKTEDEVFAECGEMKIRKVTYFSLTVDHAIIDGKAAGKFLGDIQRFLDEMEV